MATHRTGDPFIDMFFSRIPSSTAASFTPEQLSAVKLAFGARSFGAHAIDLRLSIPLWFARYYVVFLAGRERRSSGRRAFERHDHPLARLGNAVVIGIFGLLLMIPILVAIYAFKSALGIKLIPGGGGHAMLRELFDQIGRMFR